MLGCSLQLSYERTHTMPQASHNGNLFLNSHCHSQKKGKMFWLLCLHKLDFKQQQLTDVKYFFGQNSNKTLKCHNPHCAVLNCCFWFFLVCTSFYIQQVGWQLEITKKWNNLLMKTVSGRVVLIPLEWTTANLISNWPARRTSYNKIPRTQANANSSPTTLSSWGARAQCCHRTKCTRFQVTPCTSRQCIQPVLSKLVHLKQIVPPKLSILVGHVVFQLCIL